MIRRKFFQILLILTVSVISFVLIGCQDAGNAPEVSQIVVTEVYDVIGEEVVITRIIELTPTPTPQPTPDSSKPPEPVTLDTVFLRQSAPSVDPQQPLGQDGLNLIENIFVGLTRMNYDTNQVEPMLAENWEITENGRVWTFTLREDIFWVLPTEVENEITVEPVRPVTAQDIVFAVQRACSANPSTPDAFTLFIVEGCEAINVLPNATAADLEGIGVKALNNTTLQITLTKPAAHFLTLTSMPVMRPLPPELIEEFGEEWQSEQELQLVTSGPFFPHNSQFTVLQANPLWPLPRKPNANVDIVNINYVEDELNAFELWQERLLDLMSTGGLNTAEFNERLQQRVQFVPGQTLHYLGFNFESGVFREDSVRRAFSAAIDRERLVEEIFGSNAIGMQHLMPPGVVAAVPINEVGVGYSPDYARQQLAESGFRSCQLIPEITLLVSSSDLSLQQAELIQRMWIDELDCSEDQITIEQAQFGTLLANTRATAGENRPDVWELAWASYYPDAQNWMGDLLHCDESENRQKRPCAAVDDLIRQANTTLDLAERETLYREIEHTFFGESGIMPIAPLYIRGDSILVQGWLTFTPALFGGEQYDTYQIDVTEKTLQRSR